MPERSWTEVVLSGQDLPCSCTWLFIPMHNTPVKVLVHMHVSQGLGQQSCLAGGACINNQASINAKEGMFLQPPQLKVFEIYCSNTACTGLSDIVQTCTTLHRTSRFTTYEHEHKPLDITICTHAGRMSLCQPATTVPDLPLIHCSY